MALILNIETATSVCSVSVSLNAKTIVLEETDEKNIHAEKITQFIRNVLKEAGKGLSDMDAIAIGSGPGSYTGLRIGASTAKGLCYATGKPLIAVSTLEAMAEKAREETNSSLKVDFYCPMIDARRQEVYMAVYDASGFEVSKPEAKILDATSFSGYLEQNKIAFFGDGMPKLKKLLELHQPVTELKINGLHNVLWLDQIHASAANMGALAEQAYIMGDFKDVAYFEPFYLKDFIGNNKY